MDYCIPGDRVRLRLMGGKVVDAVVRRKDPWRYLVEFGVRESWGGTPPFTYYNKTKWVRPGRLY